MVEEEVQETLGRWQKWLAMTSTGRDSAQNLVSQPTAAVQPQSVVDLGQLVALLKGALEGSHGGGQGVKLPTLEIPKFDGHLRKWINFKGCFESSIHNNPRLDAVQKMRYLQLHVTGAAKGVFAHLELSEANYATAWSSLNRRYNNKKLLVEEYLKWMVNIKGAEVERADDIKRVLDEFKEAVYSLKNLGEPLWNALIVFLLCSKLPADTVAKWEHSLGRVEASPPFEELEDFLEIRIRTLHGLEASSPVKKSNHKPAFTAIHVPQKPIIKCSSCSGNHLLYKCDKFLALPANDRVAFVQSKKLCYLCLNSHGTDECKFKWTCRVCKGKHNGLLHVPSEPSTTLIVSDPDENVLLATALINLTSSCGVKFTFRAVIDQCSTRNFVSEHLMQTLKWKRSHEDSSTMGIGGNLEHSRGSARFEIQSKLDKDKTFPFKAAILKRIARDLDPVSDRPLPEFNHLDLADPRYYKGGKIDLLLGGGMLKRLVLPEIIVGSLMALKTHLGWILSGGLNEGEEEVDDEGLCLLAAGQQNAEVNDDSFLRKFWETEERIIEHSGLSKEEADCEDFYKNTTVVGEDGRYICRLPFRENAELGQSRRTALGSLYSLEKKFSKDQAYKKKYEEAMNNYFELGHARIAPPIPLDDPHYYIPHLAVMKESSLSTKTRIVFNASSPSTNLKSLNDNLMVGPTIQKDIIEKIMSFRLFKHVMICDIVKMYRQINIHPDDWKYQRFLWRVDGDIKDCCLTTCTFGTASAPFTAIRTLVQLATDKKSKFPVGAEILLSKAYVDDLHYGASTKEEVKKGIIELVDILECASFEVRKFASDSPEILKDLPTDHIDENVQHKFMGLMWDSEQDTMALSKFKFEEGSLTKRAMLQNIAKIFDPLGWMQPVIMPVKVLLQDLWKEKLSWDEKVPENFLQRWEKVASSLLSLSCFKIPRCITPGRLQQVELHGFADASQVAYGAVIYIKWSSIEEPQLIISKSRVAPIKITSIPRLELKAALLLSDLMHKVNMFLMQEGGDTVVMSYSDSKVVLAWIEGSPEKWKPFVRNRVATIQDHQSFWHYVATAENPADLISRGCDAETLESSRLWFHGPEWLQTSQPLDFSANNSNSLEEEEEKLVLVEKKKDHVVLLAVPIQDNWATHLAQKYSNFGLSCRVLGWVLRFVNNCRAKEKNKKNFISVKELKSAETVFLVNLQRLYFVDEFKQLESKNHVARHSTLREWAPFIDGNGLLRESGRIEYSVLPFEQRHPILLPAEGGLVKLLAEETHRALLHGGVEVTWNMLKRKFRIIHGLNLVKGIVRRCINCIRSHPRRAQQLMGTLPRPRVTFVKAFLHTGVDFAEPVRVRTSTGRGIRTTKGYIAVFVCMAVKAFHFEVVSALTTDAFLAALSRFRSRRGKIDCMYSDNGSNFVGAFRKLANIDNQLARRGVEWKLNPPLAPHFGGLWEAGVKSAKGILIKHFRLLSFTFEELSTVLCGVELDLNARPLCPGSRDKDALDALTPQHFLTSDQLTEELDGRDFRMTHERYLSRWEKLQKLRQNISYRYRTDYLVRLNNRPKNEVPAPNLSVDQLVLVEDEGCAKELWPLGRITATHPGPDGLVRVVSVRTRTGIKKRPIVKIFPLPINEKPADVVVPSTPPA